MVVDMSNQQRWLALFAAIITELSRRIEGGSEKVLAPAPGSEEEKWRRFVNSIR